MDMGAARAQTAHAIALGKQLDEATALFSFAVGFTTHRPLRVDEYTTHVHLLGTDSPAGLRDAERTAIAIAFVTTAGVEMVTSTRHIATTL